MVTPDGSRPKKDKKTPKQAQGDGPNLWMQMAAALAVFLIITVGYSLVRTYLVEQPEEVPISRIATDISRGAIKSILVEGDKVTAVYLDESEKISRKESGTSLTDTLANYQLPAPALAAVEIDVRDESGFRFWLMTLAPILVPALLLFGVIWYLSRQLRQGGMQAFSFGKSMARMTRPEGAERVTFKDVAGAKEAKQELLEIVDFLKNPKKFILIGARIPKGVLLMGAPGTGKTLLARAVAGEAGVPFFSISGSEFVEMFVGVGASRVRDLFQTAKKSSPAIIFIDEIDAVGRVRGTGVGGGNDEREQTLNQILVEMDGFEPNEKVIVMAATNRPDVLDPALLRPGRFDRRVVIDLPDRKDREEILLHVGPERRSHVLNKKEKEITAYHEAGHALIASVLPYADPVHKISIISRGRAAGYTLKLPLEERRMQSRREFLDDIAVSLGGYVAEKIVFDDITTGASNDLQVLTALARNMVARYGMSDKMGPIAFAASARATMFGEGVDGEQSQEVAGQIDAEVRKIITEAHKKAEDIIEKHRAALNATAARLIEVETIEREEFEHLLIAHGITPKKKEDIEHQPLA